MNQIEFGQTPLDIRPILGRKHRHRDRKAHTIGADRIPQLIDLRIGGLGEIGAWA